MFRLKGKGKEQLVNKGAPAMEASAGASMLLLITFIASVMASGITAEVGEMPMLFSRAEMVRMAGYGEERLSSVLIGGTLRCEACLEPGSNLHTSHVSGAKIAIACNTEGKKKRTNRAYGITDEYGDFMVDLPSQLHAIARLEDACIVRVLHMPKTSFCRRISRAKPRRIKLSSVGNGIRAYTTGTIRFHNKSKSSSACSRRKITN